MTNKGADINERDGLQQHFMTEVMARGETLSGVQNH